MNTQTTLSKSVEIDELALAGLRLELAAACRDIAYSKSDDEAMQTADCDFDEARSAYRNIIEHRLGCDADVAERRLGL